MLMNMPKKDNLSSTNAKSISEMTLSLATKARLIKQLLSLMNLHARNYLMSSLKRRRMIFKTWNESSPTSKLLKLILQME
jgi:hypothetical protein